MRAKLKGKITSMERGDHNIKLNLALEGKIMGNSSNGSRVFADARNAILSGTLILKPVAADDIKIGSVITVEVSDEESDNRIE